MVISPFITQGKAVYIYKILKKASEKLHLDIFLTQTNFVTTLCPVLFGQSADTCGHRSFGNKSLVCVQSALFLFSVSGISKLLQQITPRCNEVRKEERGRERMSAQRMVQCTAVNKLRPGRANIIIPGLSL